MPSKVANNKELFKYKIYIEYFGPSFSGWASSKVGTSVQECLERGLNSLSLENIKVCGAGRTDAGVHALNQVAHFAMHKFIPNDKLPYAINAHINNENITVKKAERLPLQSTFHARFSAKEKFYRYKIFNREHNSPIYKNLMWHVPMPLNLAIMNECAQILLGSHNFNSFRSTHCQSKDPNKTINNIIIRQDKEFIEIDISAPSFMYNQVRIIVGTLVDCAKGKISLEQLKNILHAKDRTKAGRTAPAYGLYMLKVIY